MRMRTAILIFCLVAGTRVVGAQRPAEPPMDMARARALAGCWSIALGAWSQPPRTGPAEPTTRFRLDTIPPSPPRSGVLVAERLAPEDSAAVKANRWRRSPYWRMIGRDSVQVVAWSTSFEAEVLYAHVAGDSL